VTALGSFPRQSQTCPVRPDLAGVFLFQLQVSSARNAGEALAAIAKRYGVATSMISRMQGQRKIAPGVRHAGAIGELHSDLRVQPG
jgi:hypothetical protein